jgi:hypothetical protein
MKNYEKLWKIMKNYEKLWKIMKNYEKLWKIMKINNAFDLTSKLKILIFYIIRNLI